MVVAKKVNHKKSDIKTRLGKYLETGPVVIPVTNRYPEETLAAGKALSREMGITFNKLVVILLKEAVSQNEKK